MQINEQNKKTVERFNKEFIENGNMDVFDEIIAEDFINHTAPEGVTKSREGVKYFFNQFLKPAFPDLKVVIHDQLAEGDKVTTRKSFQATHKGNFWGLPASNKKVNMEIIDIIRLKDGKFIEHWNVLDWNNVISQISTQS